jgi:hypothetical protein
VRADRTTLGFSISALIRERVNFADCLLGLGMSALDFLGMADNDAMNWSSVETLLDHASASAQKVNYQDYQGDYEQQVD